jgi:hypothetical protein
MSSLLNVFSPEIINGNSLIRSKVSPDVGSNHTHEMVRWTWGLSHEMRRQQGILSRILG